MRVLVPLMQFVRRAERTVTRLVARLGRASVPLRGLQGLRWLSWLSWLWNHRFLGPVLKVVVALGGLEVALQIFLRNNEPPPGVLAIGTLLGMLYALVAFGLILVYRANRIINFAQAEIGATAAVLGVLLIKSDHWPYLLALAVTIGAAMFSGAAVDVGVVRRFSKAPRLVLSVATIGVSLIFAVLQFYLPKWLGGGFLLNPTPPKTPFSFGRIRIDPLYFDANSLVILVAGIAVAVGLFLFFKRTKTGMAVRAAAENADRARLLGISTERLSLIVWMLAGGLSAIGVFLRVPVVGIPVGADVGPYVLLYALSAAVIARMESFSVAAVAGIAIGVIEQSMYFFSHDAYLGATFMLPILLVSILLQRRRGARALDTGVETWSLSREFRPVPPELVRMREVPAARASVGVVAIGLLIGLPYMVGLSQQILASVIVIYAIVAVSMVILTGWAGQISLGQWGLAGVGAIVVSAVTVHLQLDFLATLALAGLAGALVSAVIGIPALRIQGLYLAVVTLAFAIAVQVFFMSPHYFPSWFPSGIQQIARPKLYGRFSLGGPKAFYFVCLAILALSLLSARSLRRSRAGRALIAARDNERCAASFGVSVRFARLSAFGISGFWAAIGGALFAYHEKTVNQGNFDPSISLLLLTIVVLGGVTSLPGAVLGAAFIGVLKYGGLSPAAQNLASGAGVLLILYVAPNGAAQVYYGARDALLRVLAARRNVVVPSLLADVGQGLQPVEEPPALVEPELVEAGLAEAGLAEAGV